MQRVPSIKHVFILQVKGLAVWSEPEVCSRLVEQTVWNRQPEPKAEQLRLQVNVPVVRRDEVEDSNAEEIRVFNNK